MLNNDLQDQFHSKIGPYCNEFNVQRNDAFDRYEAYMDPKTRTQRGFYVWMMTSSALLLTLAYTRRPRPLIRNTTLTYTIGSIFY